VHSRAPFILGYGMACLSTVVVTSLALLLKSGLGQGTPILFLAAVMISAWYGGLGPGLVATVLSVLSNDYFFIDPRYSFAVHSVSDILQLVIFAAVAILINILTSAQHRAERVLRESAEAVRLIVKGALDGVITTDAQGLITGCNPQAEKMLELGSAELVGKRLFPTIFPSATGQEPGLSFDPSALEGSRSILNRRVELTAERPGGTRFPAELALIPSTVGGRVSYCAFIRDITNLKEEQERMKAGQNLLEKKVRERTSWLGLLYDVTRSANEAESLDQAFKVTVERLCQDSPWQYCQVYRLTDQIPPELVPTAYWSSRDPGRFDDFRRATQGLRFGCGQGLPGRVLETGRAEWVADLKSAPSTEALSMAIASGMSSAIAFPVKVGPEVVAVIETLSRDPVEESRMWLDLLGTVGLELGQVAGRHRLQEGFTNAVWQQQQAIAQELHDNLGQTLTAVGFLGKTLSQKIKGPDDSRILQRMNQGIGEAIDQIRDLAKGVSPVELHAEGLMSALAQLAVQIESVYGVPCSWECPRAVLVDNDQAALHLFRIAQEALTNAIKHGRPRRAKIALEEVDGSIVLGVSDDGAGFQEAGQAAAGSGLSIMRYRANVLGGTLRVESAAGEGTRVTCRFPRGVIGIRGRPIQPPDLFGIKASSLNPERNRSEGIAPEPGKPNGPELAPDPREILPRPGSPGFPIPISDAPQVRP
jgi:PAS domain S-box-containing protein